MTTKRITREMLEFQVELINEAQGRPAQGIGSLQLDYYREGGGYKLVEILESHAEHDTITSYRLPANAMYYLLKAYKEGYYTGKGYA